MSVIADRDGRLVILDAGSGLRPLGHELMAGATGAITADILLSHTHWDHIQGLPFFKPLSAPGNCFCIYGAAQEGVALEEILRRQMDPMVFPGPAHGAGRRRSRCRRSRRATIAPRRTSPSAPSGSATRAPRSATGSRPAGGGRDIAYVTDNELGDGARYPVRPRLARAPGRSSWPGPTR